VPVCPAPFPKTSVPTNKRVPFEARVEFTVKDPVKLTGAVVLSVEFSAVWFESVKRHPSTRVPFRGRVWSELELLDRAVAFWDGVKDRTRERVLLPGDVTLNG
jgi:hypothetical protein